MSSKIQVTFSDDQLRLIDGLTGLMGLSRSEIVRTIVVSWLSEKGMIQVTPKSVHEVTPQGPGRRLSDNERNEFQK